MIPGLDQAAQKFYQALSNCVNPYTQLWHAQTWRETQDTVSTQEGPKRSPGTTDVQRSHMKKVHLGKHQALGWDNLYHRGFDPGSNLDKRVSGTVLRAECRMEAIPAREAIQQCSALSLTPELPHNRITGP